jgi:hypothetical protein
MGVVVYGAPTRNAKLGKIGTCKLAGQGRKAAKSSNGAENLSGRIICGHLTRQIRNAILWLYLYMSTKKGESE